MHPARRVTEATGRWSPAARLPRGVPPPVRDTGLALLTWVMDTQARNSDTFRAGVLVAIPAPWRIAASVRGGCDPSTPGPVSVGGLGSADRCRCVGSRLAAIRQVLASRPQQPVSNTAVAPRERQPLDRSRVRHLELALRGQRTAGESVGKSCRPPHIAMDLGTASRSGSPKLNVHNVRLSACPESAVPWGHLRR